MVKKENFPMSKPKKQKAIGYLAVCIFMSFIIGMCAAAALERITMSWSILFAIAFTLLMFRLMLLITEIDMFFEKNFDDGEAIDVRKDFKESLGIVVRKLMKLGRVKNKEKGDE